MRYKRECWVEPLAVYPPPLPLVDPVGKEDAHRPHQEGAAAVDVVRPVAFGADELHKDDLTKIYVGLVGTLFLRSYNKALKKIIFFVSFVSIGKHHRKVSKSSSLHSLFSTRLLLKQINAIFHTPLLHLPHLPLDLLHVLHVVHEEIDPLPQVWVGPPQ